jgi:hypothetical protein
LDKNIDKEFNFNKFWGSPLIEPHVVFCRNSNMYCVYCGNKADTREHCPSRAFLNKPYPTDLPTVPACKHCNNGFSADERYTSAYINYLYEYYEIGNIDILVPSNENISDNNDARKAAERFVQNPYSDERLMRIFTKLAIGHVVYEMSAGYYSQEHTIRIARITYGIKPLLEPAEWKELERAEIITNEILPEVGSRAFRNIYVVEMEMNSVEGNLNRIPMLLMDWVDVQAGYYKYQVYLKNEQVWVKMIIRDFLYCEVVMLLNNIE